MEKRYWEEFGENYLPAIEKLTYKPGKTKSDYCEIRFGKHYYFNLAIRQGFNQFNVELICRESKKGDFLLSNIFSNEEYICDYVMSSVDNIYDVKIHDRNITAIFNADIYNCTDWDSYMNSMGSAIICLYNLINETHISKMY